MKCIPINVEGGGGFICGNFRRKPCAWCSRTNTKLCDQKMSGGRTCDAPMCDVHAFHAAPNVDFCPIHAALHRPLADGETDKAPKMLLGEQGGLIS